MDVLVSSLIGLQVWGLTYAVEMPTIQFGDPRASRSPLGHERVTGAYALHIQCPWAITLSGLRHESTVAGIAAKSALTSAIARKPRVIGALDGPRGTRFELESGMILELESAACAPDEEAWRLFRPGDQAPHLVKYGSGTRRE
jgi:hypothetical protein